MDKDSAVHELEAEFPGADIDCVPPDNPKAVICHVHPTYFHPEFSMDVAIIDMVEEHFHLQTFETIKVLRGRVTLNLSNLRIDLGEQQKHTVHPPTKHCIHGDGAKIEMTYSPGWRADDHFPIDAEPSKN